MTTTFQKLAIGDRFYGYLGKDYVQILEKISDRRVTCVMAAGMSNHHIGRNFDYETTATITRTNDMTTAKALNAAKQAAEKLTAKLAAESLATEKAKQATVVVQPVKPAAPKASKKPATTPQTEAPALTEAQKRYLEAVVKTGKAPKVKGAAMTAGSLLKRGLLLDKNTPTAEGKKMLGATESTPAPTPKPTSKPVATPAPEPISNPAPATPEPAPAPEIDAINALKAQLAAMTKERDAAIEAAALLENERNQAIAERDAAIVEKGKAIAERDAAIQSSKATKPAPTATVAAADDMNAARQAAKAALANRTKVIPLVCEFSDTELVVGCATLDGRAWSLSLTKKKYNELKALAKNGCANISYQRMTALYRMGLTQKAA